MNTGYKKSKTLKKFFTNGAPPVIFVIAAKRLVDHFMKIDSGDDDTYVAIVGAVAGALQGAYSSIINFWKMAIYPKLLPTGKR